MQSGASHEKRAGALAVLSTYWRASRGYPFSVAIIAGSGLLMQAANLIAPLYMRQFFNVLASGKPTSATFSELLFLILMVALFLLVNWTMTRLQNVMSMYMQSRVMKDLYAGAFEHLLGHSYAFFISRFAGALTHKVNKFARAYETLLDAITLQFFPTFLFVAGATAVLTLHNKLLGAMLGGWAVLFVAFQVVLARKRQPLRAARAEADTAVTGTLADAISNQSAIALFSGKRHEERLFARVVEVWHKATLRVWYADEGIWALLALLFVGINIALLSGAVIFWQRGELTVGDFVLIQSYLLTAFNQLLGINRELRRFNDAFADASEMVAMLEMPHEVRDAPGAKPLIVSRGAIAFRRVGFHFRDPRNPILERFDLAVLPRQKLALVGPSGAGKTTITRLLLRFWDVGSGAIEIDGQNIARVTQESLRGAISYVPQEPVLFHRSLMENIRYGRRDASDAEVFDAAEKAHCREFISQLPEGYATFVGERGVRLSGGERQRVAIARAILKNAPILVLDEATSSLDSESEALIQDALKTLMQGKTVLVIAHRLSTIMNMDRIVVLEKGRIVADGTHEQLLAEGGLYHKLWSIQAGGFLADASEAELELAEEADDGEAKEPPVLRIK